MSGVELGQVRFGALVPDRGLHGWEWRAVELLRAAGAEVLLILHPPDPPRPWSKAARALDGLVARAADLPTGRHAGAREQDYHRLQLQTICAALSPAERSTLSGQRLKFILFFGAGEVPGELPSCAELGVWRYARSAGIAGEFPFVQGLRRRDDVVSFGLEQVAEHGRPRPLMTGHFRARNERNRSVCAQVLHEAGRWPLLVLRHALLNGELPAAAGSVEAGRGSEGGSGGSALALAASLLVRDVVLRASTRLASYLVLETWTLGFARMDARTLLTGAPVPGVKLLPRLELGRYVADPFILSTAPELSLLVEDYSDFGVGRIAKATVRDPFGTPEADVEACLESRHHMSYPFLFRDGRATYCLPECHQSNASLLYRYDAGKLTPVTDLVPGARVTDGTILFHDGRYWLFCGLEDDNDQVNLHLFFSNALGGSWSAHPLNPVKTDVRSSRSAGPIIAQDGALFRPTQDCSRSYGYGLSVNRIDHLTVTRFEETVVATIGPETVSASCEGVHTLAFAGDLMVIDAKFRLIGLKPLLVRALRRLRRVKGALFHGAPFRSQSA